MRLVAAVAVVLSSGIAWAGGVPARRMEENGALD
jgi:hypothetical protein